MAADGAPAAAAVRWGTGVTMRRRPGVCAAMPLPMFCGGGGAKRSVAIQGVGSRGRHASIPSEQRSIAPRTLQAKIFSCDCNFRNRKPDLRFNSFDNGLRELWTKWNGTRRKYVFW